MKPGLSKLLCVIYRQEASMFLPEIWFQLVVSYFLVPLKPSPFASVLPCVFTINLHVRKPKVWLLYLHKTATEEGDAMRKNTTGDLFICKQHCNNDKMLTLAGHHLLCFIVHVELTTSQVSGFSPPRLKLGFSN